MLRWPLRVMLFGCAGVLLGIQGCSRSTVLLSETDGPSHAETKSEAPAAETTGAPFRLPSDAGGALLGKLLPPQNRPGALPDRTRHEAAPLPPPRLTSLSAQIPEVVSDLPRLGSRVRRAPLQPEMVLEEGLEGSFFEVDPPQKHRFTTAKRIRVEAEDASLPPPLPVLSQPTPDRVSLDDATTAVSKQAVLSAAMPQRRSAAPFQRMAVPEPYENRLPLTVKLPAESVEPVAAAPKPPRP